MIDWLLGWGYWWEEEEGVVAVLKHGLRSLFPQPVLCIYIYNSIYHGPPKPTFSVVFTVNNLVFW